MLTRPPRFCDRQITVVCACGRTCLRQSVNNLLFAGKKFHFWYDLNQTCKELISPVDLGCFLEEPWSSHYALQSYGTWKGQAGIFALSTQWKFHFLFDWNQTCTELISSLDQVHFLIRPDHIIHYRVMPQAYFASLNCNGLTLFTTTILTTNINGLISKLINTTIIRNVNNGKQVSDLGFSWSSCVIDAGMKSLEIKRLYLIKTVQFKRRYAWN